MPLSIAFKSGMAAYAEGVAFNANPYAAESPEAADWAEGWYRASLRDFALAA